MNVGSLKFHTYSGMTIPLEESDALEELRTHAARYLWIARKRNHYVTTLSYGESWEVQTEGNVLGLFVTDEDGTLSLTEPSPEYRACAECGDVVNVDEYPEGCSCGDPFEYDEDEEPQSDEPPFGSFPEERASEYPYGDLQGTPYRTAVRELRFRSNDNA